MRLLLLLALMGLIVVINAIPANLEEQPADLLDLADVGALHSNGDERPARQWGGGWGGRGGWGGGGWGGRGGWGGGWGGRGGWGGGGWGGRGGWGGGWGRGGWGGGWG